MFRTSYGSWNVCQQAAALQPAHTAACTVCEYPLVPSQSLVLCCAVIVSQVVEYNSSSSLYEQLLAMRATTVFVGVHTSNLANAPLLQPGSAVFEIIQVCDVNAYRI